MEAGMDELVEAVARAIDQEAWEAIEDGRDAHPDSMWDLRREIALAKARAALEAVNASKTHRVVPLQPDPLGHIGQPIVRMTYGPAPGDMIHITGEDVVDSGLWEDMVSAAAQKDPER